MYGGLFYLICLEDFSVYDVNNIASPTKMAVKITDLDTNITKEYI